MTKNTLFVATFSFNIARGKLHDIETDWHRIRKHNLYLASAFFSLEVKKILYFSVTHLFEIFTAFQNRIVLTGLL